MNLFSEPVTALMLLLVIATIIGVTLGLCSLEQATHSAKKAGELIGISAGSSTPWAPAMASLARSRGHDFGRSSPTHPRLLLAEAALRLSPPL